MRRILLLVLTAVALLAPATAALGKDGLPCDFKGVKAYPGDNAPGIAIAQWMGYHAQKAGLPTELPVMAALVESGLRNLDHGDGDAFGYFAMRASIWNTGPYAGFPTNPTLQLQWFIDQALSVRAQRRAAGLPLDEAHYGEWVADAIRPAEQDRGLYQPRLGEARDLLCPPCAVKAGKDYPGDTAPKAAIAAWMGYGATKAGLPAGLPVMAALVESGLTNLAPTDTDAAGYFAMRIGIWDAGPYLGFPTNPTLQLQWFIDHALLVREQRLAAGLPIGEQYYGEWAADVIRPPEQYRGLYQQRLDDARALLCL
jgi:hypothetical protein